MLDPLPASKWNYRTAAHLLHRAGFGGTPSEIEELVELGPERAVGRLVDFEKTPDRATAPDWARPDPKRAEKYQELRDIQALLRADLAEDERRQLDRLRRDLVQSERREQQQRVAQLRGWWLDLMVRGPRPLQEKLTIFWHGHFATSAQKVRDAYYVWRQNQIFRRHAAGNWLQLLTEVSKDPAMLIWLDQAQSRRQHPNENFAREVMELFALGEGNYTEKDVTEAARAFTGWTLDRLTQRFEWRPRQHDDGTKTILGRAGRFNGDDVLKIIVSQPQAARFISARLWRFFASEEPPSELVNALAAVFRRSGHNFKPLLKAMFRSEAFYSEEVIGGQVKSPVQWLVGTVRMLEQPLPPQFVSAQILKALGQDLFFPPNVKGWDGGISWITTNSLLNRYNFAALFVLAETAQFGGGQVARMVRERADRPGRVAPADVQRLIAADERADTEALMAALEKRFLLTPMKEAQRVALREFLNSRGNINDQDIRQTIRLLMATPEYQLT